MKFAGKQGIQAGGIQYVFSFATGAAIINVALLLLYGIYCLITKQPFPSFHFR